jgi:hypothetical protein
MSALILWAAAETAAADLLREVTGLEVDRHFRAKAYPCNGEDGYWPPAVSPQDIAACPVSSPETNAPAISMRQSLGYRNLFDKTGSPPVFAHDERAAVSEWRLRPDPTVDIRALFEYGAWHRDFSGAPAGFAMEHEDAPWRARGSLALTASPRLTPVLALGAGSDGAKEFELAARGVLPRLSWSLAVGRREATLPITLDLPEYRLIRMPFILRQDFEAVSVAWKDGPLELAWTSRAWQNRHPGSFREPYTLSDSGRSIAHRAGASLNGDWRDTRFRTSLDGEILEGRHAFRGVHASDVLQQFSYEEARHEAGWIRADLRVDRGRQLP